MGPEPQRGGTAVGVPDKKPPQFRDTEPDHDLVVVDEFDALCPLLMASLTDYSLALWVRSIELKKAKQPVYAPPTPQAPTVSSEAQEKYPAKLHARKVAKHLGASNGLIYLPGLPTRYYEDSDQSPDFRQRRYFYYMSGANFEDCAITYDIAKDRLVLWIPWLDPRQVLYLGSVPTPKECMDASDVDEVCYIKSLDRFLKLVLGPSLPLYVLHAKQIPPQIENLRRPLRIDTSKLQPAMDLARVIKTDHEVDMIRRANRISSEAHRLVLSKIKSLSNEREIEALFLGHCLSNGAKRQAYPVIAGSGTNASTLHYNANDQPLEGRELVCLDASAEWGLYASDITRTFPVSGQFSKEGKAIYDIVDRMQRECIERVRPGVPYYTLHLHAMLVAVVELFRLGILHNGTPKDVLAQGTGAAFFPHGLGHHIGLEVHDVDGREGLLLSCEGESAVGEGGRRIGKRDLMTPRANVALVRDAMTVPLPYRGRQVLEKNMVFTIEPGIYFCRQYIEGFFLSEPAHAKYINKEVLERYYPVGGVRIEDCIAVTEDGYEDLTTAPKGEEALRIINGEEHQGPRFELGFRFALG